MPNTFEIPAEAGSLSLGSGPPVVLVHGLTASRHDWRALAPELAQSGLRAIAVDLLGHGESPKPRERQAYRFKAIYKHLYGWLEAQELALPISLCGHSLGGALCLAYALEHPARTRSLVLINPVYKPSQLRPWLRLIQRRPLWGAWALRKAPIWLIEALLTHGPGEAARFPGEVRKQVALDYKTTSPQVTSITSDLPDLSRHLARMAVPSLVIWGQQDRTLQPESFAALVNRIPNAKKLELPECGHQPHLCQPELVNPAVLAFLRSVQPSPTTGT